MKALLLIVATLFLSGCATTPKEAASPGPTGGPLQHSLLAVPVFPAKGLFVWPVTGSDILAPFGARVDRVVNKGIDIRTGKGTAVRATRSGRVAYRDERQKGYGKTVIIDHENGYQTVYAFNSEILVKTGDTVSQGDVIARSGATGRAREPSLHFEVRKNGIPINPVPYLGR